jgi:hypothetical protein
MRGRRARLAKMQSNGAASPLWSRVSLAFSSPRPVTNPNGRLSSLHRMGSDKPRFTSYAVGSGEPNFRGQ